MCLASGACGVRGTKKGESIVVRQQQQQQQQQQARNLNTVVAQPMSRRGAIVRATSLLSWSLLSLLVIMGTVMSRQAPVLRRGGQGTAGAQPGTSVPQYCVVVGHDACYLSTSNT